MRSGIIIFLFIVFGSVVWGIDGDMGVGTDPNTNGSSQYPYLIEDFSDFQVFRSNTSYWASGIHTKLMCDIDLDPTLEGRKIYTNAIIAKDTSTSSGFQGTVFNGIFDGNNHIIDNMTIEVTESDKDYLGLFGKIDSYGEILRLGVINVSIQGGYSSGYSFYVGGLCGANFGIVADCYVTGSISGYSRVGGLCGWNSGKEVDEYFYEGIIKRSYAHCSVTALATSGGLCGLNGNIGVIEDSYATGAVTGGDYSNELGGLCGKNGGGFNYGLISNCFATVIVTGGDDCESLGGLCGYNSYSSIDESYATGEVIGGNNSRYLGGLCGYIDEGGHVVNCYSTGSISGEDYLGGFCGYNLYGTYVNCFWDIETSGITKGVGYIPAETGTVLGKTTSQMQMQDTFLDAEWEFADFQIGLRGWYMPENSYPKLDWQNPNASLVPNVTNMSFIQARAQLIAAGLTVGKKVSVKSWQTPVDVVAGIPVHAGGYVDNLLLIDLYVSGGSNGNGSQAKPFEIAGKYDLDAINTNLSSCYIMTADIYLDYEDSYYAATIAPASRYYPYGDPFADTPFSGNFDGGGYIISNLNVSSTEVSHVGLFGYIDQNGIVTNLGIKNSIAHIYNGHTFVALLCAQNLGNIKNCYIEDSYIYGGGSGFGGICGENYGDIEYCYVEKMAIDAYQANTIGLLCGRNYEGTIRDCYSTGEIVDSRSSIAIGGFCGALFGGDISNCYSTGTVIANSNTSFIGGLCGYFREGTFNNCFWDIETSGVIDGIGNEYPDPNDVKGKATTEMQVLSTFTNATWDFVCESINGENDIWRMCVDGIEPPRLSWELSKYGDFACGDGVDIYDLQILVDHWLMSEELNSTTFSYACDANGDGVIDLIDFSVLGKNW